MREFVASGGAALGMRLEWHGEGVEERGIDAKSGRTVIKVDPRYFRPTEVDTLLGMPARRASKLGWKPEIELRQLVNGDGDRRTWNWRSAMRSWCARASRSTSHRE